MTNPVRYQTRKAERDGWECKSNIGSGGFGTVLLWENKHTKEQLALKQCRLALEGKHKKRWQLEVTIMQRLDHPNVVTAIGVPDALLPPEGELPRLAMEYCSGGDLRKLLNKPENCCGLRENTVQDILHDIAGAIEYLHSRRIIHRDLKPENIVLQHTEKGILYKVIDLGYAKELDEGSLCTSFVGTLQYLAPELFSNKEYTKSVDYWSFGNVIYECVTGYRPFLPNLPPVKWHGIIMQKKDDDICAYVDMQGDIKFSPLILSPNHLCQPFREALEKWLKLMLMWNPKRRGGQLDEVQKRPKSYIMIDNTVDMKVAHIYCIHTNRVLSYVVSESITMLAVQTILAKHSGIPVKEQELLLASGVSYDPRQPSIQLWSESLEGHENFVFLFRSNSAQNVSNDRHIPELVQCMISEPQTLLPYDEHRKTWAQAVYFCGQQTLTYQRQLQAQRAAMMSLLRFNSNLSKLKSQMTEDCHKVAALIEFFKISHKFDVESYLSQADNGVASEKLFNSWKKMEEDLVKYQLQGGVKQLEEKAMAMQAKIMELQKSPYCRIKQMDAPADLIAIEKESHVLFNRLRQASKDQRQQFQDNSEMYMVVVKCLTKKDTLTKDLSAHLSHIMLFKSEVASLMPKLDEMLQTLRKASSELTQLHQQRQKDIWTLVRVAGRQRNPAPQAPQPAGKGRQTDPQPLEAAGPLTLSVHPHSASMLQSMMSESNGEDSLLAINENEAITLTFLEAFKGLKSDTNESLALTNDMDWSFLKTGSSKARQSKR